jgi:ribosome biogenesis GTPase
MSKRRINKQQSARMEKKQQDYHSLHASEEESILLEGLVITRFSRHAEIEDQEGNYLKCTIRPNLSSVVSGDKVLWQYEGDNKGAIISILPRTSVLARINTRKEEKPVAANITQVVITLAPKPEISWPLLDSYLVMAELLKVQALIVLNKTDMPCEELKTNLISHYQTLGYPLIFTQKNPALGYEELQLALDEQVSVFVGQSGVGKSSLISNLLPFEKNIIIGEIATLAELGKHTTSNSRYYHIPTGGALIDSPGVRAFSLGEMDRQTLVQGYREFKPLISHCKFRNCNHMDAPGCAILQALGAGKISKLRYDNFKALV